MKVITDTNTLISALVSPTDKSPPYQIIKAVFFQKFTLLLPEELFNELVEVVVKKSYLRKNITILQIEAMIELLTELAKPISPIKEKIPKVVRDPKDDYLLAYATIGKADYLVTGDKDLLVLKKVNNIKIVSPREFINILKKKNLISPLGS